MFTHFSLLLPHDTLPLLFFFFFFFFFPDIFPPPRLLTISVCLYLSVSFRLSQSVCTLPSVSVCLHPSVCLGPFAPFRLSRSVYTLLSILVRLHPSVCLGPFAYLNLLVCLPSPAGHILTFYMKVHVFNITFSIIFWPLLLFFPL